MKLIELGFGQERFLSWVSFSFVIYSFPLKTKKTATTTTQTSKRKHTTR